MFVLVFLTCCQSQLLKIHVAELPSKYNSELYVNISMYEQHKYDTVNNFILENPLGQVLGTRTHARRTCEHAAAAIFWKHLATSRLRTSLQAADWVFVPLATEFTVCLPSWSQTFVADTVADFFNHVPQLLPALGQKPHVMVLGHPEGNYGRCTWAPGSKLLHGILDDKYAHITRHILFASIEVGQWWLADSKWPLVNRLPIPYPSHAHQPYSKRPKHVRQKERLVVGAFSPGLSTLRTRLAQECRSEPDNCAMINISRSDTWGVANVFPIIQRAWFCLQPAGDTYSRKSLFDCMAVGTIPVVFDQVWLDMFPFHDRINVSKFILIVPAHIASQPGALMEHLGNITLQQRLAMQQELLRVWHLYQYSVHPDHSLVTLPALRGVDDNDDAFTFTLKSIHLRLCHLQLLPRGRC